jgi:hypothetical protein
MLVLDLGRRACLCFHIHISFLGFGLDVISIALLDDAVH